MNAAKTEFLDDLENEFGGADEPTASQTPRPGRRRKRLVVTGLAAALIGGLFALNPTPATAADACVKPNFVRSTHYKFCSLYASTKHEYRRTETKSSGGHVMTCHHFWSSYRSPCSSGDFATKACRAA
ncbi:hypothetical protein Val02_31150 [Virgisporangium aliadipatigenens]|uniref:Uncharacterized protein n=1 Tax=Virgisporangium aliadipatigenens TaxID=741659 RepID=A0A8J3YIZ2_9ACTN|nr:hypothetical protein [Virgisporangium aliadipatigenens]GIJ46229.1 hypothetical protein Val02_31150 [Virgisporangium aliadipatigenens]